MVRKPHQSPEILTQAYSVLRFSHLKFANLIAILTCILVVIFLNSQNEISQTIHNGLLEINSTAVELMNKPWEMTNKAKDYVDEKIYQKEIRLLQDDKKVLEEIVMLTEVENKENRRLKALLNFSTSEDYSLVSTRILKSSLDIPSQGFLIPVGRNKKINTSAYVVDGVGLVGKVTEVAGSSAKIRLITSINSKTPVVFSESREQAILVGNSTSGNTLHIIYCSNQQNVRDGEMVVTSGDGSIYPYGILVGKVVKQESGTYVKTLFEIDKLEFVKVYFKDKGVAQ
ncbi:MAG: rod shape-determining protein MreC [Candidatus Jidaibacter sp.]|jgi:rod shape-determining protein MreC|nr:rod shape-determining protein MreC [Candidatus Jidaibacter sp.]